jgi:hypothetical protein
METGPAPDLTAWVHDYLIRDEDVIVPVKQMWNVWHATHPEPSFEEFTTAVLADVRIEEMGGVDHTEGMDWMSPEDLADYVREMEVEGYFSGPRVKLKSRELSLEHLARMLQRHTDRMEWALRQARTTLPEDASEQDEARLIDAIVLTQELRRSFHQVGLGPLAEPPTDPTRG